MDQASQHNLRHNIAAVVELATVVSALRSLSKELTDTNAGPLLDKLATLATTLLATDARDVLATVH